GRTGEGERAACEDGRRGGRCRDGHHGRRRRDRDPHGASADGPVGVRHLGGHDVATLGEGRGALRARPERAVAARGPAHLAREVAVEVVARGGDQGDGRAGGHGGTVGGRGHGHGGGLVG